MRLQDLVHSAFSVELEVMERHDISRVELHASEQKFIHVMTGSYLVGVLLEREIPAAANATPNPAP